MRRPEAQKVVKLGGSRFSGTRSYAMALLHCCTAAAMSKRFVSTLANPRVPRMNATSDIIVVLQVIPTVPDIVGFNLVPVDPGLERSIGC